MFIDPCLNTRENAKLPELALNSSITTVEVEVGVTITSIHFE